MKIQMIVHGLDIGGAESMVAHLARHLARGGDTVEIDCLGELGRLGDELRGEGFPVLVQPRRPGFDASLPARLAMRVHRARFDVVHLHQRTALFYGLLGGLLHRAPIVYTEHGPLHGERPRRRQKTFNRLLGRRLARITAVSRHLRGTLAADEGFAASSIEVVPNAVDVARFAAPCDRDAVRRAAGLPAAGRILATVGRLDAVKNQRVLLHVVERLKGVLPDLSAVLIGDGPEGARLAELARRLDIRERVFFLGARRDVERLLPAFDIFCLPSLAEGTPVSLLEAMAARVPIVATTAGGIPEVIGHDREGILIDDSSAAAVERFADAVAALLRDGERARRLTEAAFRRVGSDFSMQAMCARYREVLSAAARGTPAP